MPATVTNSQKSPFLLLPRELRRTILENVIGFRTLHMLRDSKTVCGSVTDNPTCTSPTMCHDHLEDPAQACGMCRPARAPALLLVCRVLHYEALPIYHSQSLISFMATEVLLDFTTSTRWLRRVHLDCGPAKSCNGNIISATLQSLSRLTTEAINLKEVHLRFQYYYRILEDILPVNEQYIFQIMRFTNLHTFSLLIDTQVPGPTSGNQELCLKRSKITQKVNAIETILKRHVCIALTDQAGDEAVSNLYLGGGFESFVCSFVNEVDHWLGSKKVE